METKTSDLQTYRETRRIHLDEIIPAVCKSFYGSFDEIPSFIEEVRSHLLQSGVNFNEEKAVIVFNDLRKNLNRDNLKIYSGLIVEDEIHENPPYFLYHLIKGKYLHSNIPTSSFEDVSAGVENLLDKKNYNGSTEASTAIFIIGNKNGEESFDLYMKLKDSVI
jgi:effector-binding domain-containing protein